MPSLLRRARALADLGIRMAAFAHGDPVDATTAAQLGLSRDTLARLITEARANDAASDATTSACAWREGDDVVVCSTAQLRGDALAWAGVAHELRNALTAIGGWAQVAASSSDLARARHAAEMVRTAARDAMDVAPMLLDAGDDGEVADVARVVRQVVERLGPVAGEREVVLACRRIDAGEAKVSRAALASIVANLVKNAVEACEAGGRVEVGVRATLRGIEVVVEDDGRGMTDEAMEARFGAGAASTATRTGRGIGLSVVRALVARAGGSARVTSRVGAGSCVRVELPKAARGSASSGIRERAAARRVLVVDDHAALADLVGATLEARGASVVLTRTPEEALEAAAEERFDVALVDLDLGGRSGQTLVRELVATRLARRVVVMSGASNVPDLGQDGVLRKPFELSDVEEVALESTKVGKKRRAR